MTIGRATLGLAVLLTTVPGLAQEDSQTPHRQVKLLAPPFVRSHQQATIRKIRGLRRSNDGWTSLPSNCSTGILCPVW